MPIFPFPRYRTPPGADSQPPHLHSITYTDKTYFYFDGKAINTFPTDSMCFSKQGFSTLTFDTKGVACALQEVQQHSWPLHPLNASSILVVMIKNVSFSHPLPYKNCCCNVKLRMTICFLEGGFPLLLSQCLARSKILIDVCLLSTSH